MNDLGVITEHRNQILKILEPMLADFKREINEMRAEGASQTEIEAMLDELEACYARGDNAEGKLVLAVLREAARSPCPIPVARTC
jgi:hypothetical protein